MRHAERLQGRGHSALVAKLAGNCQALLQVALRLLVLAPEIAELPGHEEGAAAREVARLRAFTRERVNA